jgi:hypothetical protein
MRWLALLLIPPWLFTCMSALTGIYLLVQHYNAWWGPALLFTAVLCILVIMVFGSLVLWLRANY